MDTDLYRFETIDDGERQLLPVMSVNENETADSRDIDSLLPGADRDKLPQVLEAFSNRLEAEPPEIVAKELKDWLLEHPLNETGFALLGEALQKSGMLGESIVALERAMQLKAISKSRRLAESTTRLINLGEAHQSPEKQFLLEAYTFMNLEMRDTRLGKVACGRSLDGTAFLRILIKSTSEGLTGWQREVSVLKKLTSNGCQTAPALYAEGNVNLAETLKHVGEASEDGTEDDAESMVPYVIEEFLTSTRGYRMADLALALLEQQALGVYHGNISPSKIFYDAEKDLCRFRSFDESVDLEQSVRSMFPRQYVNWLNRFHQEKTKKEGVHFLHNYRSLRLERDFWCYFKNGSLDLAWTGVFKKQITTGSEKRIYHSHPGKRTHILGERGLKGRLPILKKISFRDSEEVVDVGCASGLLCEWLHDNGCQVTGVDMDRKLIRGNRILANISHRSIEYYGLDVEHEELPGDYDTLILFSTLQHFLWPELTMNRLLPHCRERILVEAGLVLAGGKWIQTKLERTPVVQHESLEDLVAGLDRLMEGFEFSCNHGQVDGGRYLLEWKRAGNP